MGSSSHAQDDDDWSGEMTTEPKRRAERGAGSNIDVTVAERSDGAPRANAQTRVSAHGAKRQINCRN